ncbi:Rz-like lysis system protein LysB [Yersinia enterocolitica]|uniref:Rz-like lysis system protein LysB n=1 Tax=Yersinia enterocolitica TaxID=630 RepID=UPI0028BC99CF|nr:LysB family phage lysis regulatory protein [Yersinia enterocolitica]EKN6152131.1 LysB family phage lysis regulatory protein [Yersinia enterocolitica]ELI8281064.1 LysB family phage lysis regulatory protein [Yersinia enterocolitica]HDL8120560.1 LysB family phage lysis regulatory protein [Yersinia enterocolitica]HDL8141793.1 LysB family phage lysis regulatory protein [Yersinia enterocolitica]
MRIVLIFIAGVVMALGWHAHRQNLAIANASNIIGALSAEIESRDSSLIQLQEQAQRQAKSERILRQSLSDANHLSQSREQKIQRLLNENKALRNWSVTALPADVIRLHQRPSFANPNDYLRWLSDSEQLPAARQQSSD